MKKNDCGFTLMEVIITVAIIGILTAIALPSIFSWRENSRYVGTIQKLSADLQQGKLMAIRENAAVGVVMNESDYIIYLNQDDDASYTAGDVLLKEEDLPFGYRIDSAPIDFEFSGRGTIAAFSAEKNIQVTARNGKTGVISINMIGRIAHTL